MRGALVQIMEKMSHFVEKRKKGESVEILENKANIYETEETKNWPYALQKATNDTSWNYLIKLTDGSCFHFTMAKLVNKDYARLIFSEENHDGQSFEEAQKIPYRRGIEINVNHIVWIVDDGH